MSIILMTTLFNIALVLQGEIWCWSLLVLKGLTSSNKDNSANFSGEKTYVLFYNTRKKLQIKSRTRIRSHPRI